MKSHQSDGVVFLFQSPKEAIDVMAENHGTIYPKKCFKNISLYLVMASCAITLLKDLFSSI
jgi:hypothetical protein